MFPCMEVMRVIVLLDLYTWKSSCLLPVGMNSKNAKTVGTVGYVSRSRD